jgi:nucleoside-diphosphate-sugar epimerase
VSPAPVLVPGGTGFIGSHLVERLASMGIPVRVASRDGRWRWGDPPAGCELVRLDLADPDSEGPLRAQLRDVRAVVNLAGALMRPGIPHGHYARLHVGGTQRLVAALRAEASRERRLRLLHVSSVGALGPTGTEPLDESASPDPRTVYETTKLAGEKVALHGRAEGVEVAVLRPGLIYGPRDLHLLPLFRAVKRGTFRTIAGGRALWQPLHVQDLVEGIAAAVTAPGLDGGTVHLAGAERVSVAEFGRVIASAVGARVRGPDLPLGLALAGGALLEALLRPFGVAPPLTRARVRTLTQNRVYRIERARERLGWTPRIPLAEGVAATARWYRDHGYL